MSTNKEEDFRISGPSQLTAVDWGNSNHRRVVMASLVDGVYVQESDRANSRRGGQALAPPWWESFHFTLKEALHDKKDKSIYGAIYQLNTYAVAFKSPKFVIAFRGTRLNVQDLKLDYKILINKLRKRKRVKQALKSVMGLITSPGGDNTFLAGHSLGAAIALLVGKELAKGNCKLETYLFNSPIVSFPLNLFIKDEKIKKVTSALRTVGRSVVIIGRAALSGFIGPALDALEGRADPFNAICEWMPHLYVNLADPICCEYINYFEHRETMRKHGLEMVERIANKVAILPLLRRKEPMHLLASAELNISDDGMMLIKDGLKCHSLAQWYDVDLRCRTVEYRHKDPPLSITSSSCG